MTAGHLFSVANSAALLTWMVLVAFQRRHWARNIVVPAAVSLFAVMYAGIVGVQWAGSDGGFSSLAGVSQLFSNEWLLLAGCCTTSRSTF